MKNTKDLEKTKKDESFILSLFRVCFIYLGFRGYSDIFDTLKRGNEVLNYAGKRIFRAIQNIRK